MQKRVMISLWLPVLLCTSCTTSSPIIHRRPIPTCIVDLSVDGYQCSTLDDKGGEVDWILRRADSDNYLCFPPEYVPDILQ